MSLDNRRCVNKADCERRINSQATGDRRQH